MNTVQEAVLAGNARALPVRSGHVRRQLVYLRLHVLHERHHHKPDSVLGAHKIGRRSAVRGAVVSGGRCEFEPVLNACRPTYCDVTRKSTTFHRTYTTLAKVGGLWGLAVIVVTLLLWPLIAFLLVWCSVCCSRRQRELRAQKKYLEA